MSDCTRWSFQRKIDWFRSQFAQHASLPFSDVLPAQAVTSALETLGMHCYNSLYNPVTVLCLFLSQVIHPNPTLAATVESFLAWRLGQGMSPCSTDTGGYARARQRLPEALLAMLVRHTGSAADRAALAPWRWLGRTVKLFDGSTVSMPDTPENQAAYPQSRTQAAGVGFPLARIGVLFSLSVGTVLNLGIRRWAGKLQSELAMLRDMIAESRRGRRFAHRSLSLLLHGNRVAAAARRRFRGTNARETARRFSPRPAAGPLRSCGPMEQARATRMDVLRTIRRHPRDPFDPRVSLPDRPPWLSPANDRGGHDAVERQAIQHGRHRRTLSSSLGCRNQPPFAEDHDEHGRASLPVSRDGPQGDLGPFAGVQPDPNSDRAGGGQTRQTSAANQLHPRHADSGGFPFAARPHAEPRTRRALRTHVAGHRVS